MTELSIAKRTRHRLTLALPASRIAALSLRSYLLDFSHELFMLRIKYILLHMRMLKSIRKNRLQTVKNCHDEDRCSRPAHNAVSLLRKQAGQDRLEVHAGCVGTCRDRNHDPRRRVLDGSAVDRELA